MKKWTYLYVLAAAAVIGCGGEGSPIGGGGTTGVIDGRSVATVLFTPEVTSTVDMYVLPGQGRAAGDKSAKFRRVYLFDRQDRESESDPSEIDVLINGFNGQNKRINVDLEANEASRTFDDFYLEIKSLTKVDANNFPTTYPSDPDQLFLPGGNPQTTASNTNGKFPGALSVTAFYGRWTALQIFLHDGMLDADGSGAPLFDRNLFLNQNKSAQTNKITGYLSDYVSFDIDSVPSKPQLQSPDALGQDAQRLYVSGDNYALSQGGGNGVFEVLTPFGVYDGIFKPAGAPVNRPTYELKQNDPRFLFPPRQITALKGFYRPYTDVTKNTGEFEFITIPGSFDDKVQELVIIRRDINSTTKPIVEMFFGKVNYLNPSGPNFQAWPIDQIDDAHPINQVNGTLPASKLLDGQGRPVDRNTLKWWQNVKQGDFVFTTPPSGLDPKFFTGRFIVFRR